MATDIEALQRQVPATARYRRTSRGGRHAGELLIAACAVTTGRSPMG